MKFAKLLDRTQYEKALVTSAVAGAPMGTKQNTRQDFVKSWILAGGFGEKFVSIAQSEEVSKSFKECVTPVSMKELMNRYSENEISTLLEDGCIT